MKDEEFLAAFEDCSLPFDNWTHRAHVKVAYLYLRDSNLEQAIKKMRAGVQAYNSVNKVPEGPMVGYNETTTAAFLHLVCAIMSAYDETHPTSSADDFCDMHPQLLSKHVLRFFYSPERRMHPDAKTQFIEPDLTAFPDIQPTSKKAIE